MDGADAIADMMVSTARFIAILFRFDAGSVATGRQEDEFATARVSRRLDLRQPSLALCLLK